jgi:ribonuclease P protein component
LPGLFIFTSLSTRSQHTLNKNQRLKSRKQIDRLFKEGHSFHLSMFKVYHQLQIEHAIEPLLFGVGVGTRHFKKAVHRNRIKRIVREAYRLQKQLLTEQLSTKKQTLNLFFIYTGKELPLFDQVVEKTKQALHKLQEIYK